MRSVGLLVVLVACRHSVSVPRDEWPSLNRFAESKSVTVHHRDEAVDVTPAHAPEIRVKVPCTFRQALRFACAHRKVYRLDESKIVFEPDRVMIAGQPYSLDRVEKVELSLRHWRPEGWRPRWGFGIAALGPALLAGYQLQYMPIAPLAFEAGVFAASHVGAAWVGTRVRSPALGVARGFVGGFATFASAFDPSTDQVSRQVARGGRVGVDLQLARFLLTLEFDVVYTTGDEMTLLPDGASPWGGTTFSYTW